MRNNITLSRNYRDTFLRKLQLTTQMKACIPIPYSTCLEIVDRKGDWEETWLNIPPPLSHLRDTSPLYNKNEASGIKRVKQQTHSNWEGKTNVQDSDNASDHILLQSIIQDMMF